MHEQAAEMTMKEASDLASPRLVYSTCTLNSIENEEVGKDEKGMERVSWSAWDDDAAGLQICATKGCQVQWLRLQKHRKMKGKVRIMRFMW